MMKDTFIFQILTSDFDHSGEKVLTGLLELIFCQPSLGNDLLCMTFHIVELNLSWDLISFHNNLSTTGFKKALF